jgi:hypothetical protein
MENLIHKNRMFLPAQQSLFSSSGQILSFYTSPTQKYFLFQNLSELINDPKTISQLCQDLTRAVTYHVILQLSAQLTLKPSVALHCATYS